jgi:hypothetical protein
MKNSIHHQRYLSVAMTTIASLGVIVSCASDVGKTNDEAIAVSEAPVVTQPPAVHGYDQTQYVSNPPPVTCPTPMTGSGDCAPLPTCSGSANCVAVDSTHNVCNYFPKQIAACNCFKGQEDFCYIDGTSQLGVKKCQYNSNTSTYEWGTCTSPGTAP